MLALDLYSTIVGLSVMGYMELTPRTTKKVATNAGKPCTAALETSML
jgi:uncharacterized membrane protein